MQGATLRIVFFGNHTVGVRALQTLTKIDGVSVTGVVAHPPDPEDGSVYLSVYDTAKQMGLPAIRARGTDPEVLDFLAQNQSDLIFVTDYRYLLPASVISAVPKGAVNLHPSLLPAYRGRAPLNWAIICGEKVLGLTAHYLGEGVDDGDILEQVTYTLDETEDVSDALERLYPLYVEVTDRVARRLLCGAFSGTPQPAGSFKVYPRRTPSDGLIDWNKNAHAIRDLVRAVTKPYPGAFARLMNGTVIIWKADYDLERTVAAPGTLLAVDSDRNSMIVACQTGRLLVKNFELCGLAPPDIAPGRLFF